VKVQLELFTANICTRCVEAKRVMTAVAEELGDDQFELTFFDVLENLDHAVEMAVPFLTTSRAAEGDSNA
jgi:hypothetical protein